MKGPGHYRPQIAIKIERRLARLYPGAELANQADGLTEFYAVMDKKFNPKYERENADKRSIRLRPCCHLQV